MFGDEVGVCVRCSVHGTICTPAVVVYDIVVLLLPMGEWTELRVPRTAAHAVAHPRVSYDPSWILIGPGAIEVRHGLRTSSTKTWNGQYEKVMRSQKHKSTKEKCRHR